MTTSEFKNLDATGKVVVGGGTGIVLIILITSALLYGAFSVGFVGMKLWAWYVVPVFSLPALTWVQAFGISLLVRLLTYSPVPTGKDAKLNVGGVLLYPWIVLLLGWLVKIILL